MPPTSPTWGAGTAYGMTTTTLHTLVDLFVDGQQWFIRGDSFDPMCMGRNITRPNATVQSGST